jgi:hypothetical protein
MWAVMLLAEPWGGTDRPSCPSILRERSSAGGAVGAHSGDDDAVAEDQDLGGLLTRLVSEVDHYGVDAGVYPEDLEPQVGVAPQALGPICAQRLDTAHDAV